MFIAVIRFKVNEYNGRIYFIYDLFLVPLFDITQFFIIILSLLLLNKICPNLRSRKSFHEYCSSYSSFLPYSVSDTFIF